MAGNSYTEGYLKGYEEGLNEAWNDVVKLTNKGLTGREIAMRAKAVIATVYQKLDSKKLELSRQPEQPSAETQVIPQHDTGGQRPLFTPAEGESYLVKESRPEKSFRLFSLLVSRNIGGLCISRTEPGKIRGSFKEGKVKFLWLTRGEDVKCGENCIQPDLSRVQMAIREFMDRNPKSAIVLEGLNYLITYQGFMNVLKFVQSLRDEVTARKCYLIIPVDPQAMDLKDYRLLESEMQAI
jgi:hypothetical protein